MRAELPKSNWRHSRTLEDVSVAFEMGIPISEFWAWSEMDQAFHIAKRRAQATMMEYDELVRKPEGKKNK